MLRTNLFDCVDLRGPSSKESETRHTKLIVDRRSKRYAFFVNNEQVGNWMGYVADDEPQRIADEMDIQLEES